MKLASGLWCFNGQKDRFNSCYTEFIDLPEQIKLAGKVRELEGVELHNTDFKKYSVQSIKDMLGEEGLSVTTINTDTFSYSKWRKGAFAHPDKILRQEAVDTAKENIDFAREINSPSISLWLGADGFDYPFQVNHEEHWERLINSIREVAEYAEANELAITIEYKNKEPRKIEAIGNAGIALFVIHQVNKENLGVTIDFGHSLQAKENPAAMVAMLSRENKLFNIHFNDCYRDWDDDLIVGSVNIWETVEFLYQIKKCDYQGYIGLDQFAFRENPLKTVQASVDTIKKFSEIVENIDEDKLNAIQHEMEGVEAYNYLRDLILK